MEPLGIPERYTIERELGSGGMGRVYVARDLKLGREVAIKVLSAGRRDQESLRRFEQEARAAASLEHPNIIAVHDVGETAQGPFIVSELLHGETLRARMEKGSLSVEEIAGIARQLATGLAAAHGHQIIHRDLKPENLFLTQDGRLKILDFGIAKVLEEPHARLTETGVILGTIAYMSPEQVRGLHVDARSDVFSFGSVVYEMLAGKPPFERPTAVETGAAILHDAPAALDGKVPAPLAQLVLRCLEKDREKRYPSGRELARDLAIPGAERETSRQRPPPPLASALASPGAPRGSSRRRLLLAGLSLLLLAGVWLGVRRAAPEPRIPVAVADFVNETGDPDLSGLSGMLITSLDQSHRLSVLTRSRMFDILRAMGKPETTRIDEAMGRSICQWAGVRALVLASVRRFGEVYAVDLKALDPSSDEYLFTAKVEGRRKEDLPGLIDRLAAQTRAGLRERAADIRAASLPVAQIATTNLEAWRHYFRGEELYALGAYLRADEVAAEGEFRQAIGLDPQFALAHFGLGLIMDSSFRSPKDELETALLGDRLPQRERCLAQSILEGTRAGRSEEVARQRECAARFPDDKLIAAYGGDRSFHEGEAAAAVPYFERALAIDPTFAMAAEHLATALAGLGRTQEQRAVSGRFAAKSPGPLAESLVAFAQETGGEGEQAAQTSRRAAEAFPRSAEPWLRLTAGMLFRGEPEAAAAVLGPLLERPQLQDERSAIAQALIRVDVFRGRYRAAIAAISAAADAAVAAGDKHVAAQRLFWQALVEAGGQHDPAAARRTLQRMQSLEPGFDTFMVLADLDDLPAVEAGGYFNDAFADLWTSAARARKAGRAAEALAAYEQLARAPYIGAQMGYALARLHLEAGRPAAAIAALKRVQSTYPGVRVIYWDPELWFPRSYALLGAAYERAGDRASALQAYQRFLSLWKDADPDLPELRDAAARAAALR